ncbi:hypothetical protein B9Z55_027620 [Caenorhabditis nigoni]|nr:hypothetical protein B9Z55_027620 [Caenorhabditis nigoni]
MVSDQPFLNHLLLFDTEDKNVNNVNEFAVQRLFFASIYVIRENIFKNCDSDFLSEFICWAMMMKNVDVRADHVLFTMASRFKKDVLRILLSPGDEYYSYPTMLINGTNVDMRRASLFLQFLRYYVDGNVTEIHIFNQYRKRLRISKTLHREIVQTLVGSEKEHLKKVFGMEQLCGGCKICFNLVDNLDEHSFVTLKMLRHGSNTVFDHIAVPDLQMFEIARRCLNDTSDKESCLKLLSSIVKDNICVKKLTIPSPRYEGPPVEVLTTILKQWKVESAVLDVRDFQEYCDLGSKKQFFTRFSFGTVHEEFSWTSTHFIDSLTIRFNFTGNVFRQMQELMRNDMTLYNRTSNIRKVISSSQHIAIVFTSRFNYPSGESNVDFFPNIVNTANMEEQSNFTLEFILPVNVAINAGAFLGKLNASKNEWMISSIASNQERDMQLNEHHDNHKWEKMRFFNKKNKNYIILHVIST